MNDIIYSAEKVKDLLWRLNELGENLINEGNYYKKIVKEIKKELKGETK